VDCGVGFKTEWEVTLKDAKTGRVKLHLPWHKNTILDSGLNRRLSVSAQFSATSPMTGACFPYIAIGTNNTEPATTDTTLGAETSRKIAISELCSTSTVTAGAPYFILGAQWGTSEGNGDLKEVGLVSASSGGTFWSRNLFRDEVGDPITVTKTSADILTVRCKTTIVRASDTPYSESLDGRTVKGLILNTGLAGLVSSSWWGSNGHICGTDNSDPVATQTYIRGTNIGTTDNPVWAEPHLGPTDGFYIENSVSIKSYQCNGNIGEILCRWSNISNAMYTLHTFTDALPKDATKQLDLTFRITLSRV
jgi:hypothetical protein